MLAMTRNLFAEDHDADSIDRLIDGVVQTLTEAVLPT